MAAAKEFDKKHYDRFDLPGKMAVIEHLFYHYENQGLYPRTVYFEEHKHQQPDLLYIFPEHGIRHYHEVEIAEPTRWSGKQYDWPWPDYHVLYRKTKYLEFEPLIFWTLRADLKMAITTNAKNCTRDKIAAHPNKYDPNERVYKISLKLCSIFPMIR